MISISCALLALKYLCHLKNIQYDRGKDIVLFIVESGASVVGLDRSDSDNTGA
jgi:hypothetical protein